MYRHGIVYAMAILLAVAGYARAGDRYAFLVAVREYDKNELTSLQFTENDIARLAETLKMSGYASDHIVLMTQAVGAQKFRYLPLAENIRTELSLLVRELKEDDSIVVAFAGHGVQFKNEKNAYFCPTNARLADRETLISLEDVYKTLDRCAARTKVLLVDACRNDPQSNRSRSAREVELEATGRRVAPVPPGGIAALFSCSATEQSYEDPDLKHGVFFHYVIDGLRGKGDLDKDGDVSLAELEQHVTKSVQRYVRIELGRAQTPERRGEARGLVSLASVTRAKSAFSQASATSGPEHLLLKELEGTWEATVTNAGRPPYQAVAVYKMECDGLWLVSDFNASVGSLKFQGRALDGYDPEKKKFVYVWIDSLSTFPMVFEGTYDAETKTQIMFGEGRTFDGKPTRQKSVNVMPDKDHQDFKMYRIDQDGNEYLITTVKYTRRKP
jgi:hypothetical protein